MAILPSGGDSGSASPPSITSLLDPGYTQTILPTITPSQNVPINTPTVSAPVSTAVPSGTPAATTPSGPSVGQSFSGTQSTIHQPLSSKIGPADNINLTDAVLPRGFMVNDATLGSQFNTQVNFQYNPSNITVTNSIQTAGAALNAMYVSPSQTTGVAPLAPTNNTLSWTMLYDATYALWGNTALANAQNPVANGTLDHYRYGVWADIYQIMKFTGMVSALTSTEVAGIANANGTATPSFGTGSYGVMMMIPSFFYFDNNAATGTASYYGFITEWDYTITHWTQNMIPMRCAVDVTVQLLPVISSGVATAANSFSQTGAFPPTSTGSTGGGSTIVK